MKRKKVNLSAVGRRNLSQAFSANLYENSRTGLFSSFRLPRGGMSNYFGEVIATGEKVILELSFCDEGLCGFMVIGDQKTELRPALQE